MSSLTQADSIYRQVVEGPGRELAAALVAARMVPPPDLTGIDVTNAVLLRLKSFFIAQDNIKFQLNKVYAAPAADFFVETVAFFLCVVLEKLAHGITVASEKNAIPKSGSIRPDISLWRDGKILAAIECKTQLGWNRGGWLEDFNEREKKLHATSPNAKLFLLVMTGSNWPGFGQDPRVGNQFYQLLHDVWPREYTEGAKHLISNPIEMLVRAVIEHAEA